MRHAMSRLPSSIYHAAGFSILVLILMGWWFGLHLPKQHALQAQRDEIQRLQSLLERRADLASRCVRQERANDRLFESIQSVSMRLHAEPDVAGLFASFAALAAQSGSKVIDLQPQPVRLDKTCGYLPLRCRLQSDWQGLCAFLEGIPQLQNMVRIDSIQLGMGTPESLSPTTLEMSLVFAPRDSVLGKSKLDAR